MDRRFLEHLTLVGAAIGAGTASSAAQTIHHSIQAPAPATSFGGAVTMLGDWDGDGHDDFAVGDWKDAAQGEDAGTVIVYSGWSGAVLRQYHGLLKDRLGYWIDDAGDVNADGYADLLIGTLPHGDDAPYVGVVGGPNGDLIGILNGDDLFGQCVAGVGDLNGDGHDDILVGVAHDSTNATRAGAAHVFSGRYLTDSTPPLILQTHLGTSAEGRLGWRVASAGDIDDDGVGDILIGSQREGCSVSPAAGIVRVFSGQTGALLRTVSSAACDGFGASLDGVGDVDLDGFDDFIVGASAGAGRAIVYSGQTGLVLHEFTGEAGVDALGQSAAGAGDVNGDGFPDVVVGAYFAGNSYQGRAYLYSGKDWQELARIDGDGPDDLFGGSVDGGRDVNGDGLMDVIAGAGQTSVSTGFGYVEVFGPACATFATQYCSSTVNSSGNAAYLVAVGSPVVAENDVRLVARFCPPGQLGLFLYGENRTSVPFGDGVRCIAPVRRIYPAHVADASGTAVRDLDLNQTPFDAGPGEIQAGSTWNFQFWFRDPAGPGGSGFNASRAVQIQFCP